MKGALIAVFTLLASFAKCDAATLVKWPTNATLDTTNIVSTNIIRAKLLPPDAANPIFRVQLERTVNVGVKVNVQYETLQVTSDQVAEEPTNSQSVITSDAGSRPVERADTFTDYGLQILGQRAPDVLTDSNGLAPLPLDRAFWREVAATGDGDVAIYDGQSLITDFRFTLRDLDSLQAALVTASQHANDRGDAIGALEYSNDALALPNPPESAESQKAWALTQLYRAREAVGIFAEIPNLTTPLDELHYAYALNLNGNETESIQILTRVVQAGNNALGEKQLAEGYYLLALDNESLGGYSSAISDMKRAYDIDPNNMTYDGELAILYEDAGNSERSGEYKAKAIDLRASLELAQHNDLAAVSDATEAIRVGGSIDGHTHLVLGAIYLSEGRTADAANEFDEALVLSPSDPEVYYNRGLLQYAMGKYADAMNAYSQALSMDSNDSSARLMRGLSELAVGGSYANLAEEDLTNSVMPHNPEKYAGLFEIAIHAEDFSDASKYLGEYDAISPGDALGYYSRARLDFLMAHYSQTVEDCDDALALQPSASVLILRGLAKQKLFDDIGAMKDFAAADVGAIDEWPPYVMRIDRSVGEYSWGNSELKLGNDYLAISLFGTALESNKTNAMAYLGRAIARGHIMVRSHSAKEILDLRGEIKLDLESAVRYDPQLADRVRQEEDYLNAQFN